MVWPPLFHGVCGVLMLFFGTSAEVARWLVLLSFVVSCGVFIEWLAESSMTTVLQP